MKGHRFVISLSAFVFFTFGFFSNLGFSEASKPTDAAKPAEATKPVEAAKPADPTAHVDPERSLSSTKCDEFVILDIKKQRKELEEKEKTIKDKEEEFKAKEIALNDQIAKLEALKKEISNLDEAQVKKNEEKLSKLIEMVEKMGPKQAAALLGQVDEDLAVTAMFRMTTDKLAKIMNLLEPSKASKLSEQLALGKQAKVRAVASKTDEKGGENNANK
jgi:flagellar motility protein MotE (MotC chaperone)